MSKLLKPSRGIFGSFGNRSFELQDKEHQLYLAVFPSSSELLAGKTISRGSGLIKIGITGNIKNRIKALNLSFPQTSTIGWKMMRTAKFPNRSPAADAEKLFKLQATNDYGAMSLGKEFFIMDMKRAESLFNKLSPVPGLHLTVKR